MSALTIFGLVVACGGSGDFGDFETEIPIMEIVPTPEPEPTEEPECPRDDFTNEDCAELSFNDGRGGDLWKPVSESDGKPAYLLNGGYQGTASVQLELISGGFEDMRFANCSNEDGSFNNNLRQTFRANQDCTAYTGRVIVTDATKSCDFDLPANPCERID